MLSPVFNPDLFTGQKHKYFSILRWAQLAPLLHIWSQLVLISMITQKSDDQLLFVHVFSKFVNTKQKGEWTVELAKDGKLDVHFRQNLDQHEIQTIRNMLINATPELLLAFIGDEQSTVFSTFRT